MYLRRYNTYLSEKVWTARCCSSVWCFDAYGCGSGVRIFILLTKWTFGWIIPPVEPDWFRWMDYEERALFVRCDDEPPRSSHGMQYGIIVRSGEEKPQASRIGSVPWLARSPTQRSTPPTCYSILYSSIIVVVWSIRNEILLLVRLRKARSSSGGKVWSVFRRNQSPAPRSNDVRSFLCQL